MHATAHKPSAVVVSNAASGTFAQASQGSEERAERNMKIRASHSASPRSQTLSLLAGTEALAAIYGYSFLAS